MRVPTGSTVLIADGRKRLVTRNDGAADAPKLTVIEAAEDANPATRDQVTDRAGATATPAGGATLGGADAHDHEADRFARETAQALGVVARDDASARLIVIAAPATLGALRKHYGADVEARIDAEIAKDMTGAPIAQVEALLVRE